MAFSDLVRHYRNVYVVKSIMIQVIMNMLLRKIRLYNLYKLITEYLNQRSRKRRKSLDLNKKIPVLILIPEWRILDATGGRFFLLHSDIKRGDSSLPPLGLPELSGRLFRFYVMCYNA